MWLCARMWTFSPGIVIPVCSQMWLAGNNLSVAGFANCTMCGRYVIASYLTRKLDTCESDWPESGCSSAVRRLVSVCGFRHLWNQHIVGSPTKAKKIFGQGGFAPLEWACPVSAGWDSPVTDDSIPGIETTQSVSFGPPIAASPCLLLLSLPYFKRWLWLCGQLLRYFGLRSFGMCLHWDCNPMRDTANISSCLPSTSAQIPFDSLLIIHIILMIQCNMVIENPLLVPSVSCFITHCYPWNSVCTTDNVSHAENLQINRCQRFSNLKKLQQGIQVPRDDWYCGECLGGSVLNASSIPVQEFYFQ